MVVIKNTLEVSPTVDVARAEAKFQEQTVLNGKKVRGIIAQTFQASGSITPAELQACTITLVDKDKREVVDALPLWLFDPKLNANGSIQPVDFPKEIDWLRSYISIPAYATRGGQKIPVHVIFE